MPNDPRLAYYYEEARAHTISMPADGTIVLPTFSVGGYGAGGAGLNSPQLGMAVTNVAAVTGTPTPVAGLGAANGRLLGKVKVVESDGSVTILDSGWMLLPYQTGANQPLAGSPVDSDGTGKVMLATLHRGAYCEGFITDISTGALACVVRKF